MKRFSKFVWSYHVAAALFLPALMMQGYAQPTSENLVASPRLSQSQVILMARVFCGKIGQPVNAPGTATFPISPSDFIENDRSWLRQWQVVFPGQAEVHIVDGTGVVSLYTDTAYFARTADSAPPGQAIPQEEAIRRAREALDATGEQEELLPPQAQLNQYHVPPLAQSYVWVVNWGRAYNGIPFLDQGMSTSLDAQTGEIKHLQMGFPSPPLTQAKITVNQQQAIDITVAHLVSDLGYQSAMLRDAPLQIVRPNRGWSHFQDAPEKSMKARIAWVVRYSGSGSSGGGEEDTWVDAETGELLGGKSASGSLGGHRPATAPAQATLYLAQMLPNIRTVYVRRADPTAKGGWAAVRAATFTDKDQPQQVAALKKASIDTQPPADAKTAAQLVLVGADNRIGVYGYDPASGRLGAGTDWVTVPGEFKVWMQKRLAGTKE